MDGIMDYLLRFSEVCKTYSQAEKHEWGHKVLFWLVTVFWHISRLWFSDIIDEWGFCWLWRVLHIFLLNKNYVPNCTIVYWGWIIVCGLYYIFFSWCLEVWLRISSQKFFLTLGDKTNFGGMCTSSILKAWGWKFIALITVKTRLLWFSYFSVVSHKTCTEPEMWTFAAPAKSPRADFCCHALYTSGCHEKSFLWT